MMRHIGLRRAAASVLGASLAILLVPGLAAAHSELVSSDPAQGSVVSSPFSGPIVLTFSEHLANGSKADLVGPGGANVAKAVVDATAKTMTLTPSAPLVPGAYEVRWVSIADDGDLLRGTIALIVGAAASATPTAFPTAGPSAAVSAQPTQSALTPGPSAAATPAPSGSVDTSGTGGDVVLPIVVALIVVGAGAAYLLSRRNRPPSTT
jgi:copper resistance protein C